MDQAKNLWELSEKLTLLKEEVQGIIRKKPDLLFSCFEKKNMTTNDTFLLMFAKVTETLLIHEESTYYYVISLSIIEMK